MAHFSDFLEKKIASALDAKKIKWIHESQKKDIGADFYLPDYNVYIEVKQYHSERAIRQLENKDNAILIQGKEAAYFFIEILEK